FTRASPLADPEAAPRALVRRYFDVFSRDRSAAARFDRHAGLDADAFALGPTLELGSGWGRYTNIASRRGAEVVGIEPSTVSIDLAFEYIGRRPNVHLVQGDLYNLPFRRGAFGSAFTLGALNRTPDPA